MHLINLRILSVAIILFFCSSSSGAAQIAFDSAGDSAYNAGASGGSLSGVNGGYGWGGGWGATSGRAGFLFIGSSSTNGSGDPLGTGNINSPRTPAGRAWGLTVASNNGGTANGWTRPFAGALSQGQIFMADFDTGFADRRNIGEYDLVLGGGGDSIAVGAVPSVSLDYLVGTFGTRGLASGVDTGVPLTDQGIHAEFTILNGSQVLVSVMSLAPAGGNASVVTPFASSATFAEMVNFASGSGPGIDDTYVDLYVNNFAITPEPVSATSILICAGLVLATRRPARPNSRARTAQ